MQLRCVFLLFVKLKLKRILNCHWLGSHFVHLSSADLSLLYWCMQLLCVCLIFVELKLKRILTCHWLGSYFVHLS